MTYIMFLLYLASYSKTTYVKSLLTLFIFSFLIFNSHAQWVELDTGMENPPVFNDVYAITSDIVVVVGANGTILKTIDGGDTWVQKPSGITQNLNKIQFLTPQIGYAMGGWEFLKTIDGGESWNLIDTGSDCSPHIFSCVNEDLVFIGCGDKLVKSYDGGNNWEISGVLPIGQEMQFLNNTIGYMHGEWSSMHKTINGGVNWQELQEGYAPFYFLNENLGFTYSDILSKTIDGVINFELLYGIGTGRDVVDLFAINENNVWGIMAGTLDWDPSSRGIVKISSPDTINYLEEAFWENDLETDMYAIHFANETTGYVVGIKDGVGAIWKNGTGINTMATSENELIDNIKVYPNPTSNQLNITFDKSTKADITLTDITGKQIYSVKVDKSKTTINTQGFSKRTYILSIKTDNRYVNKKIIIH